MLYVIKKSLDPDPYPEPYPYLAYRAGSGSEYGIYESTTMV